MTYPSLAVATNNPADRGQRAARLRRAGFRDRTAWQLSANHDTVKVRIATKPEEFIGWQIRVIA